MGILQRIRHGVTRRLKNTIGEDARRETGVVVRRVGGFVLVVAAMFWLASIGVVDYFFDQSEWAYRARFALVDSLASATYDVSRPPHDCEFWSAPLGSKHCHYERDISTVRIRTVDRVQWLASDDGKSWTSTVDRVRWLSSDEGKSWTPLSQEDAGTHPGVWVSWKKVAD